jgi:hypothetical protein
VLLVDGDVVADLVFVDAVARLVLEARRRGWYVEIRNPSADFTALVALVGLAGALGLESCGQPEGGEQLGVEEVVEGDDLPA